jgi:hypothetical protein
MTAVSLERVEYSIRTATVLVTVMVPVNMGGGACEDTALKVGQVLESLGGICVQEPCQFNGYADAFYIRVFGTFRGPAALDSWIVSADFDVQMGGEILPNVVAFRAEQAIDELTGTPLSSAVWSFRIEEVFGRRERPKPQPAEPFDVTVVRGGVVEVFSDCSWISCQMENTSTGLRQIRKGISRNRTVFISGGEDEPEVV